MNYSPASVHFPDLDIAQLPAHVAIIMDGNGRWAKKRLLNRVKGHEKGADTVRTVVRTCRELGIRYLTLYAFSSENWQRPKAEVEALMTLLKRFLKSEKSEMLEQDIRLRVIGQTQNLPAGVRAVVEEIAMATQANRSMDLILALSYGGRDEIVDMVRVLADKVRQEQIDPLAIDADLIADHLYTRELPDPDIMIRTSGEMRISNFLLWQIAYAELFLTPTLWPDFSKEEFLQILRDFQRRERRYGKV